MDSQKEQLLTVGQVVERLKEVSPDLTVSKLHFYERQGLIHPARTRGGHRLYCPQTVERLKLILLLRSQAHLPLNTIAQFLEVLESDPAMAFLLHEWIQSPLTQSLPTAPVTEEEGLRSSGLSREIFHRVQALGLVRPCPATGLYDPEAVVALKAISDLLDLGLRLEDLVPYKDHVDAMLEHEEHLFRKVQSQHPRENLEEVYSQFGEPFARFRRFLFLNHLRRIVEKILQNFENHQNHKEVKPWLRSKPSKMDRIS